jgi:Fe2+ or Zn2+ uptake regulation protein
MSCSQPYAQKLQARGYRMTPQRHAILHILKASGGHLSPTQVFEQARTNVPGLTETTVYRTLEFLAENEIVQSRLAGGGHLVYELGEANHHHLVCRQCGTEVVVEHSRVQPFFTRLEASTGFAAIDSHLTFFGLCPDCQPEQK